MGAKRGQLKDQEIIGRLENTEKFATSGTEALTYVMARLEALAAQHSSKSLVVFYVIAINARTSSEAPLEKHTVICQYI